MMIVAARTCVYWPIQGISGARVARALDAHVRVCGKHSCGVRDNVLHAALLADLASGYYRIEVSRHVQSMA